MIGRSTPAQLALIQAVVAGLQSWTSSMNASMAGKQDHANCLDVLSTLTPSSGQVPRFTGASSAELHAVTDAAKSLLDDASIAEMLSTLGLFAPTQYDAYSSGGTYSLTATPALLSFSSTSPTITIATAGRYRMSARAIVNYAGATIGNRSVTVKMRKTNGSASDIANSSTSWSTASVLTFTGPLGAIITPDVVYNASAGDVVSVFGSIDVLPTLGSMQVTAASIHAQRIG